MKNYIIGQEPPKPNYRDYGEEFINEYVKDLEKWSIKISNSRQSFKRVFNEFLGNLDYSRRLN